MQLEKETNPAYFLVQKLQDLSGFIKEAGVSRYSGVSSQYYKSSPGEHIRHILDHIETFVTGMGSGIMNYDERERGGPIESNPLIATEKIESLIESLSSFTPSMLDRPVVVRFLLSPRGPLQEVKSNPGRELGFVLNHTIHHQAILAAMATEWGISIQNDFGLAPSTIAFNNLG